MNEPSIFIRECKSFTKVSNSLLKSNLSIIAMGLMARLLSHKNGYCIHKEVEKNQSGVGDTTFENAWSELEDNGFIKRKRVGTGKFVYQWVIINDPKLAAKEPKKNDELLNQELITEDENPKVNNQIRNTIPENPGVENQEWNTMAGNGVSNIDVNNIEVSNEDLNNKDVNKIDLINIGKFDPVGADNGTIDVAYDSVNKTLQPGNNGIDDWVLSFKNRVREYVVSNNINPDYVKDTINEFYQIDDYFSENRIKMSEDKLFEKLLIFTGMNKMHNTNSENSIQKRLIQKMEKYIKDNNIDRSQANASINNYITDENFYSLKQDYEIEAAFKQFLIYTKLNKFRIPKKLENDVLDGLSNTMFGKV